MSGGQWTAPIGRDSDRASASSSPQGSWRVPRTSTAADAPRIGPIHRGATIDGFVNRRTFRDVERFFFMIGYTNSGSTLVGTLLNAHPEVVVAQEADCFRYVRPGITRNTLYAMLILRDRQFAGIDRSYHGFEYSRARRRPRQVHFAASCGRQARRPSDPSPPR